MREILQMKAVFIFLCVLFALTFAKAQVCPTAGVSATCRGHEFWHCDDSTLKSARWMTKEAAQTHIDNVGTRQVAMKYIDDLTLSYKDISADDYYGSWNDGDDDNDEYSYISKFKDSLDNATAPDSSKDFESDYSSSAVSITTEKSGEMYYSSSSSSLSSSSGIVLTGSGATTGGSTTGGASSAGVTTTATGSITTGSSQGDRVAGPCLGCAVSSIFLLDTSGAINVTDPEGTLIPALKAGIREVYLKGNESGTWGIPTVSIITFAAQATIRLSFFTLETNSDLQTALNIADTIGFHPTTPGYPSSWQRGLQAAESITNPHDKVLLIAITGRGPTISADGVADAMSAYTHFKQWVRELWAVQLMVGSDAVTTTVPWDNSISGTNSTAAMLSLIDDRLCCPDYQDSCGICYGRGNTCWGCDGVRNSHKVYDVCGVCDGNNSTCLGCDGVPNSNMRYDGCGVCGGTNSTCAGCDGVPHSGKVLDACHVCDGNNSTCAGCDGVPNSGRRYDACGVCSGNNSTCRGCDGIPNSGKVLDSCGVCGGNGSSCAGCDGVPGSGKVHDACHVCGGNNSTCSGCDGIPNSGKALDACGVCGGNGTSCRGCDGVLHSNRKYDACHVCGGDNSTCAGCDGVPNSGARYDVCGVCDGDGSSCGCGEEDREMRRSGRWQPHCGNSRTTIGSHCVIWVIVAFVCGIIVGVIGFLLLGGIGRRRGRRMNTTVLYDRTYY